MAPPDSFTVEVAAADAAGNAISPATCRVDVPLWLAPLGTGPVLVDGEVATGVDAVAIRHHLSGPSDPPADPLRLYYLPPPPPGEPVALRRADGPPAGPLALQPAPVSTPGASVGPGLAAALQDWSLGTAAEVVAWIERPQGGAATVMVDARGDWVGFIGRGAFNADPGRDAAMPGLAVEPLSTAWLTWVEQNDRGGTEVLVRALGTEPVGRPQAPGFIGASAWPAVGRCDRLGSSELVAWLDATGGALMRAARSEIAFDWSRTWTDWPGPWSAIASGPPALAGCTMAWEEAGVIRTSEVAATLGGFGPAATAGGTAARWPRFVTTGGRGLVLLYVEGAGEAQAVKALRQQAPGWAVLPDVNAGLTQQVATLQVAGETVTWTDGAGRIFVRRMNR